MGHHNFLVRTAQLCSLTMMERVHAGVRQNPLRDLLLEARALGSLQHDRTGKFVSSCGYFVSMYRVSIGSLGAARKGGAKGRAYLRVHAPSTRKFPMKLICRQQVHAKLNPLYSLMDIFTMRQWFSTGCFL